MPKVILMGPPGAGKGTQGEILASTWQVPRISPGDIIRAEIKNQSALGKKVQSYNDAGLLVPDQVVIEMMQYQLEAAAKGWVLDGFPRTVPQAQSLDSMLSQLGQAYDHVINIDVPEPDLVQRLKRRAVDQGRADDTEEVIRQRLQEYFQKTQPLLAYYGEAVIQIDGTPALSDVTSSIYACLAAHG
ncbi:MAG: adenylate kinase [Pseudanabaenaceae cyanobacterium bins.68]|nr:adenylate kinase [Pseudanabaenaceae cyanobacterium bins.68]